MQISTVPTVKAQLVSKFTNALSSAGVNGGQVQVAYHWPGAETEPESVFLGYHPEVDERGVEFEHEYATITAGRKQRQERYDVPVTVWTFNPSLTDDSYEAAEARAFAILDPIEDVFADDPRIGLTSILWARLQRGDTRPVRRDAGWACALTLFVTVEARLT